MFRLLPEPTAVEPVPRERHDRRVVLRANFRNFIKGNRVMPILHDVGQFGVRLNRRFKNGRETARATVFLLQVGLVLVSLNVGVEVICLS